MENRDVDQGGALDLSIVIPAFNEESRLDATLDTILDYLGESALSYEILVCDDASTDATRELAAGFAGRGVRVDSVAENRGKGAAVRRGVVASRGDWVLVTDADLSTPIEELTKLAAYRDRADFVLGSRATSESNITRRQPLFRQLMGKTFNLIVRSLGLADIHDTQCGFKLMRGDAARRVFALARIDRFAFDVEVVWLARRLGVRVVEVGVVWHNSPSSTVHPIRDSAVMLWDVVKLRFRRPPAEP